MKLTASSIKRIDAKNRYQKSFRFVRSWFIISVLKKIGLDNNFVSWTEILISRQESCVINDGNTTQ